MPEPARPRKPPAPSKAFSTRNFNEAAELIETIYAGQARLDYHGSKHDFGFDWFSAALGDISVTRWSCSSLMLTRLADQTELCIGVPVEGALMGQSGSRLIETNGANTAYLVRPGEDFTSKVGFARGITLRAPLDALLERAELLTGKSYGRALLRDMVERIDLDTPVAATMAKTMKTAMLETTNLGAVGMNSLATAGYEDLLLNLAVAALFPKVAADAGLKPPDCGAATIARVRDYLRAHAGEPIETSVVASQFGISIRSMQENFRRSYGLSPCDYLTECRLDRAHQSLLLADGKRSILAIRLECGFTDHKRFSAKYRDKFGESPSETLRAAAR